MEESDWKVRRKLQKLTERINKIANSILELANGEDEQYQSNIEI